MIFKPDPFEISFNYLINTFPPALKQNNQQSPTNKQIIKQKVKSVD
jgi:hypothetical protein